MDHNYHSIPLERYSYSIIPVSNPNIKDWIHHPARDHLSLVFDHQDFTDSITSQCFVKVIWKTDVLVTLNISNLKGQSNPVFGPHLAITSRNPLISMKCLHESSQEVRIIQVKLRSNEAYNLALICFRREGCTVRELNMPVTSTTPLPSNTIIPPTQQFQTPSSHGYTEFYQTHIPPSSREGPYSDSNQLYRDQTSFRPGRAVTISRTPQQQSRRWQTDNRSFIDTTKSRDDSGLGDSQFSIRTQNPYSGGIPRALPEPLPDRCIQAPLRLSTESQANIDFRDRFNADTSSRGTYSSGTIDTASEDVENRVLRPNSLDLLVDEWNRDLNPKGRKPVDPKLKTSNIIEPTTISEDVAKTNRKRSKITDKPPSKKARTNPDKNKKVPNPTNKPQREDVASDKDMDGETIQVTSTSVTKKVKGTENKALTTNTIVPNSNMDLEGGSGTSTNADTTNEMSELFGAEILNKLLKGEKLPEIDGQVKRKQLVDWLHEPEGPGSFMQLAEDMERLWELDIIAATKNLFDQKYLDT